MCTVGAVSPDTYDVIELLQPTMVEDASYHCTSGSKSRQREAEASRLGSVLGVM
jgi:hypothetical protein